MTLSLSCETPIDLKRFGTSQFGAGSVGVTEVGREPRRRIAIFDYEVTNRSPSGSCHLRLLEGLYRDYDFTVFASEFDNPAPSEISWVRLPVMRRPMAVRYVNFFAASAVARRWAQLRGSAGFDLVQGVEGYAPGLDLSYVHFCHTAYLREARQRGDWSDGLRARVRRLDHRLRAARENHDLHAARTIVVPADHLADELGRHHGIPRQSVVVVPNPVDVAAFAPPREFDRDASRMELGLGPDDVAVIFVALGHFERKGLPNLMTALRRSEDRRVHLIVVGGQSDAVRSYRRRADQMGLDERVHFVGHQADIRAFLWSADALASPSSYEVFALAPLQGAAAGLPLLVTRTAGVAPFFVDEMHGFGVTREPDDIAAALARLAALPPEARSRMGVAARRAVSAYDTHQFVDRWRSIYRSLLPVTE